VPGLQKLGNPGRTGVGKGELVLGTGYLLLDTGSPGHGLLPAAR